VYEATEPAATDFSPPPAPPPIQAPLSSRRDDLIAIAVLFVLATVFFADIVFGVNQLYMRDLTRYYYPTKQVLRDIVLHGEFPFWNRFFSAGQPIAANPEHEVFYPFTWLILLPNYNFGYTLHILIHIYIALAGMYALLRSMELRAPAAFIGALSWGLGGVYLSEVNLLPILFCAAWLPFTCLFARRFLLDANRRDFALAALFLGLQFLVSEPTTVMQTGFLLGMYALYRGWYARPRISKMLLRVGGVAFISIAGIAIGAAQLIPAIDHVHDSARSRAFEFDLVSAWSMPWAKFAELIYPNILGHIAIDKVMWYWAGGLYPGMGSPFLFSIYAGLAVITLAIAGAFVRAHGGRLVLLVCIVSAVLGLGAHTPLLNALYKVGITSIRYPEKFALMGIFAITIFAAQMLQRLLEGDEGVRLSAIGFAGAVFVVALTIAITTLFPIYGQTFMKIWGLGKGAVADRMISITSHDWAIAVLRSSILLALLIVMRRVPPRIWTTALAIFVAADLAVVVNELNPRMPRRFFDTPPAASAFPKNRQDFRIFHEADWYGTEETARQFFSTGDAVYWVVRNGLFPMTPAGSGLRMVIERDYDKTALLPTVDFAECVWDVKRNGRKDWWEPFMAMSNAWYRGVYRNFTAEKKRNKGDFKNSLPIQFVEGRHYPRYYFADQVIAVKDNEDFITKVTEAKASLRAAFVQRPAFVPAAGVVRGVRETANRATIDVDAAGEGFLVMSVTPHKYWRITMDGARVTPIVTNVGYQGIVVTPGRHRIVMTYSNDLVKVGGTVSATAIALLAIAAIIPPMKRKRDALPAYDEPLHLITNVPPIEAAPGTSAESPDQ
jgi:hypothetical protein